MGDVENWKAAPSPNYKTNRNRLYPYSELPYLGHYKLIKIPVCMKNLIEHVDYLSEGRIDTESRFIGFRDCYNVNYEYRLVSKGPDKGRKIPNRIPFISGDGKNCCTRNYIKDNSVLIITVPRAYYTLTKSCAEDIARIVNSETGKVIVYGYDVNNNSDHRETIELLSEELMMKQLIYCPIYLLPEHLQLTYDDYKTCYRVYLNLNELKRELYNRVNKGDYEDAIILTECLSNVYCCTAVGDVVNKLLENRDTHVMVYAYKLWNNNAKDIICKHFPAAFKLIFNGDCMMIINKQYNQALKLCDDGDPSTKQAWGDNHHETSNIISWKIIPIWENDNILFKIYNVDSEMYLKLSPTVDGNGNRQVWGSKNSKEFRYRFILEPLLVKGETVFTISSCEYGLRLKLADDIDSDGDRCVLGYKSVSDEDKCSPWILAPWEQLDRNDKTNQNAHDCMHKSSSIIQTDDDNLYVWNSQLM